MQEKKLRKLSFRERFVELVESSGRTQKELAQVFGVSEGALINWKRGQLPKSEELHRIGEFFGVSMEWLLTGNGAVPSNGEAWRERALSAEQKLEALRAGLLAFAKKI